MPQASDDARTGTLIQHLRAIAIPLLATRITREGMPVIVLNTTGHPEVSDLFRVQAHVGQGEATSVWCTSPEDATCIWAHLAVRRYALSYYIKR